MPKYYNTSNEFVSYAGGIVLPGQYVDLPYYIHDSRLVLQSDSNYSVPDTVLVDETVVVPAGTTVTNESVGTGDGSKTTFALAVNSEPDQYSYNVTVYANATPVTSGVSVTPRGVVTFDTPPANGVTITASYTKCEDVVLDIPYSSAYNLTLIYENDDTNSVLVRFAGPEGKALRIDKLVGYDGRLKWCWCNHLRFISESGGSIRVVATMIHPM